MATNFEFLNLTKTVQNSIIKAQVSTCGAAIKSLSVNGIDIITPTTGHELNPFADGIVMAPWANRIDRGIWELNGEKLQLEITDTELDNAVHGLVNQQLFDIKKQSDSEVNLETVILPSAGYPFEILVQVTYRLTHAGLEVDYEAKNLSYSVAPFIIGGHPYLQIGDTNTGELEVKTSATRVVLADARKIPTETIAIAGTEFDISHWTKVSECNFDNGFSVMGLSADGYAHHYLRAPNGLMLDVWQSKELKYAFIFTPSFFYNLMDEKKRYAIAIEPQSGPANAFNTNEDLTWLEPGEIFTASWGVELSGH
jgi:aldose 1-epimerase